MNSRLLNSMWQNAIWQNVSVKWRVGRNPVKKLHGKKALSFSEKNILKIEEAMLKTMSTKQKW